MAMGDFRMQQFQSDAYYFGQRLARVEESLRKIEDMLAQRAEESPGGRTLLDDGQHQMFNYSVPPIKGRWLLGEFYEEGQAL